MAAFAGVSIFEAEFSAGLLLDTHLSPAEKYRVYPTDAGLC